MKRTFIAVLFDVRFQLRHGFYGVYVFICALYWLLLSFIPPDYKEMITLLLTFSDPSAVGLIIAGGIVLLEKDQGIHGSLFVTPLRLWEYLLAKALSLSILSLSAAWAIHAFALGMPDHPTLFSLGVLLTSSLFTLLSIGVAVRTQTINGFILLSQVYAMPLILPLLGLFDIGPVGLYTIIPTSGSLLLLSSSYVSLKAVEVVYAVTILLLGNIAVFLWTQRSFRRNMLYDRGDGGFLG